MWEALLIKVECESAILGSESVTFLLCGASGLGYSWLQVKVQGHTFKD